MLQIDKHLVRDKFWSSSQIHIVGRWFSHILVQNYKLKYPMTYIGLSSLKNSCGRLLKRENELSDAPSRSMAEIK